MLRAFALSVGQLGDPAIMRVLARSLLVTLLLFAALAAAGGWALAGYDPCGAYEGGDGCPLGPEAGGLGALLLLGGGLWFLFPAVAIGVICAYMDDVVRTVEARHYPAALGSAQPLGWGAAALLGLRSSVRVLVYNLLASPFYLVLLVTGVGPLLLFVLVNGVAFGRDLGEIVARRHLDRPAARRWLRDSRSSRALLGTIVTGLFLIPIANLLAPVIGAAMATHLFHRREKRGSAPGAPPVDQLTRSP